jgi:hypothetical protein
MFKQLFSDELEKFKEYLKRENNENGKGALLYPVFDWLW